MFIKNLSSQNSTTSIGFHWSTGGERNLSGFTKCGNHVEFTGEYEGSHVCRLIPYFCKVREKNLKANFQGPPFLLQFFERQNNCFGQLVTAWNRLGEAESWLRQSMVGWDEICDLCTMLFRTGGVADHFLLDLVGAVKCRLQIRFVPPCFVCLLTFACMVWFFDDFFVCWEHLGSQLVSLLDGVFHWFIWHGRVPTQDVYCQTSSVISTATWVYQPVLIS